MLAASRIGDPCRAHLTRVSRRRALVLVIGVIVHRPLARIPENTLKFGVGVILSAFSVFWTGEALGVEWPGHDLALIAFITMFLRVLSIAS
jgi:uncharacterized membrane protein